LDFIEHIDFIVELMINGSWEVKREAGCLLEKACGNGQLTLEQKLKYVSIFTKKLETLHDDINVFLMALEVIATADTFFIPPKGWG